MINHPQVWSIMCFHILVRNHLPLRHNMWANYFCITVSYQIHMRKHSTKENIEWWSDDSIIWLRWLDDDDLMMMRMMMMMMMIIIKRRFWLSVPSTSADQRPGDWLYHSSHLGKTFLQYHHYRYHHDHYHHHWQSKHHQYHHNERLEVSPWLS